MDSRRAIRWQGWRGYIEAHHCWSRVRQLNRHLWPIAGRAWCELIDPYAGGPNYYVRPAEMLHQTQVHGFEDLRLFDLRGREVLGDADRAAMSDPWVYLMGRHAYPPGADAICEDGAGRASR
jgi:hypothetical protein